MLRFNVIFSTLFISALALVILCGYVGFTASSWPLPLAVATISAQLLGFIAMAYSAAVLSINN